MRGDALVAEQAVAETEDGEGHDCIWEEKIKGNIPTYITLLYLLVRD